MKNRIMCIIVTFATVMLVGCDGCDDLLKDDKKGSSNNNPVGASYSNEVGSRYNSDEVYVNGYYRSDGTYVKGHYRTGSNHTKSDNWSTKGNKNPHTGKKGTK